jgi:hypothetical protein
MGAGSMGHCNITHTERYTELSPERFKGFFEGLIIRGEAEMHMRAWRAPSVGYGGHGPGKVARFLQERQVLRGEQKTSLDPQVSGMPLYISRFLLPPLSARKTRLPRTALKEHADRFWAGT